MARKSYDRPPEMALKPGYDYHAVLVTSQGTVRVRLFVEVDGPQPAERAEPLQRQDVEDIEVQEPQDFSPTAHRLRRWALRIGRQLRPPAGRASDR